MTELYKPSWKCLVRRCSCQEMVEHVNSCTWFFAFFSHYAMFGSVPSVIHSTSYLRSSFSKQCVCVFFILFHLKMKMLSRLQSEIRRRNVRFGFNFLRSTSSISSRPIIGSNAPSATYRALENIRYRYSVWTHQYIFYRSASRQARVRIPREFHSAAFPIHVRIVSRCTRDRLVWMTAGIPDSS